MKAIKQNDSVSALKRRESLKENAVGYLFISGFMIVYLVFTLYPILDAFVTSFCNWDIVNPRVFVGFENFKEVLSEKEFWTSLWHTVEFLLYSTLILLVVSFLAAALINNKNLKAQSLFRGVFFSPNVLTVTVISYIWTNMLSPYNGIINKFLKAIGLLAPGMKSQIYWTTNSDIVWWTITIITLWWTMGYNMILYLSAMQNIPSSIYESAELDGANAFQRMIYMTIPYLKDMHITLLFLQIIASFKVFGQIFLVTGGGPSGRTKAFIQYIYETAFSRFLLGKGCAASILFFIVIFVVSFTQMRIMNKASK